MSLREDHIVRQKLWPGWFARRRLLDHTVRCDVEVLNILDRKWLVVDRVESFPHRVVTFAGLMAEIEAAADSCGFKPHSHLIPTSALHVTVLLLLSPYGHFFH